MAETMTVQILRLEPMRVASTYGFGDNPEEVAWRTLEEWAGPRGFLDDIAANPIFGFNNPYPTPDHPRYGYVFWLRVPPGTEPAGSVRIEEFFGGTYAVARCEVLGHPETTIPSAWSSLAAWCRENGRPFGSHPALEKFLTSPGDPARMVLDLYCPVLPAAHAAP